MRTETKWATLGAIALFLWLLSEKLVGLQVTERYHTRTIVGSIVCIAVFSAIYYFFCREKRDFDLGGSMTWAEGFWASAVMTLIFLPLAALLIYVFAVWVHPDFVRILAERSSGGSIESDPVNVFLKQHTLTAMLLGLLFSALFPLLARK